MIKYINEVHDEERAFYGLKNAEIKNCSFEGPADGESALKEATGLTVENCRFLLRYPLWHVSDSRISDSVMTETCRAALWYCENIKITNSGLGGIKAVRECKNIEISKSKINSTEFGWFCHNLKINDSEMISEYPFLKSDNMQFDNLSLNGKYSFQYTENVIIRNSILNTKDAFWHGKNITVYDSIINGEYLGWYSDSLKLIRCKISGTQPLCYASGLVLENCEMTGCDLAFEKSEVHASVRSRIDSVKNPASGCICAEEIGEIIFDDENSSCKINYLK